MGTNVPTATLAHVPMELIALLTALTHARTVHIAIATRVCAINTTHRRWNVTLSLRRNAEAEVVVKVQVLQEVK